MKTKKAIHNLGSITILILILGFLINTKAKSQDIQSDLSGFSAGIDLHYSQWNTSADFIGALRDFDPNGMGVKIYGSYGFNQRFEGILNYAYSNFNRSGDWSKYHHTEFGAGLRYNFGATLSKIRPFVDATVNSSTMVIDPVVVQVPGGGSIDGEFQMSGFTIGFGGGSRYFIRPYLAANVHLRVNYGSDYDLDLAGNTITVEETQDLTQWYLGAGISWYFGKKF